jgi:magnesium chelatase family protein
MIAAAGEHNILMTGPPGVGKSFLAKSFRGIMPDLTPKEAIETTKIWSAAGMNPGGLIFERPFRAPHQTSSATALIGGGQEMKPGEISMAHNGVLFLDELPEFSQNTLEALRQPLESGTIQISRARGTIVFPARFSLIAAMNPCPCGFYGDDSRECKCSAHEIIKYQKRVSGPLLDRIDIRIKLSRVKLSELKGKDKREHMNPRLKKAVEQARMIKNNRIQNERLNSRSSTTGTTMQSAQMLADLELGAEKFISALPENHLSPRGYLRLLNVARTIANLDGKQKTSAEHLAEAYSYRLREIG